MHDDGYFDERVAARYDETYDYQAAPEVIEPVLDLLAELAGDGRALELGVGTGRIALPLAQRGVSVHGIELSRPMASRLTAKPGADAVGVTIGDFSTTRVEGSFRLAYLLVNTIMNLTSQEAQVACFRNVAAHLEPGGCFLIEVLVPELQRLPPGETHRVFSAEERHWGIDEFDVARQGLISHHFIKSMTAISSAAQSPSGTSGPASSISWRNWPGCGCAIAGPAGAASRSRARAGSTYRSGRSRPGSQERAKEKRMADGAPLAEQPLVDDDAGPTSWAVARERLENPEKPRTYWIATVRQDGRPHVMPIIGAWIDGALYFLSGDATRKGRNLAGDARCVIATSSTKLPSLDIIVEGEAEPVTDEAALRRVTDFFRTKMEWPLELRGTGVHGPNAPTAGPPPYTVFRLTPSTVFGLPGMTGMEQFDPAELPRPTRWRFKTIE